MSERKATRVILPALLISSIMLPGCKPAQVDRTANFAQDTPVAIVFPISTTDTTNLYRGHVLSEKHSFFVRDNGLIPTELMGNPKERIEMGISYLRRFRDALKDDAQHQGSSLSSLRINTPDNYPIAMPGTWNIWDVVNSFLNEYDNKQIVVKFYSDADSIVTQNIFKSSEKRKTIMGIGKELAEKKFYSEENRTFEKLKDTGLAMLLLREYASVLQEDEVVGRYIPPASPNIHAVVLEKIEYAKGIPRQSAEQGGLSPEVAVKIQPKEAQKDAVMFLFLYRLNQFNAPNHLSGIGENQYKYRLFESNVIKNNALSQQWLIAYSY